MTILFLIAIAIIGYLLYSQVSHTKSAGRVDPSSVAFRQSFLKTTDGRVHEQFAMLCAAVKTLEMMKDEGLMQRLKGLDQYAQEEWIRNSINDEMNRQGFPLGPVKRRLARHVFEKARAFYVGFGSVNLPAFESDEISNYLLRDGAEFLDYQFEKDGLADICDYFKSN